MALTLLVLVLAQAPAAPATVEPPRPVSDTAIPYPEGVPAPSEAIAVQVKIRIGPDGLVQQVDLVQGCGVPAVDGWVLRRAALFTFAPAKIDGVPMAVEIAFTQRFQPPPAPVEPVDDGPPRTAELRGRLRTMGTREPVKFATVAAELDGRQYSVEAQPDGRFRLPLPPGEARVTVHVTGSNPFLQQEVLKAGEAVVVTYLVERERYDPYEIVVVGQQRRSEVSRVTLRGPELTQIPGTFGDPYRVIHTLPGVASVVSLLPFPVVRGASPSSTGFLLDGARVPLLFHLMAGPSVVHPEFIDEVRFYPGGAPVEYGGYTAGIVDGRTRRARKDERLIDFDINMLQTGGLVRWPLELLDATVTGAGRIGYPGVILSLATDQVSLSYWDYQLRLDGGTSRNGWVVFAYGASDTLETPDPAADPEDTSPPLVPTLVLRFHHLDLRFHHGGGPVDAEYRVIGGTDRTLNTDSDVTTWSVEPRTRFSWKDGEWLTLALGLEGSWKHTSVGTPEGFVEVPEEEDDPGLSLFTDDLSNQWVGSAYVEALWRPTPEWLVRPGFRTDVYGDTHTVEPGYDPRLTLRYRVAEPPFHAARNPDDGVWLKGGVGLYHQPPRFFLPLPGLDTMPLRFGLLQSLQYNLGVETPLLEGFELDVNGYYNDMDPIVFDLEFNQEDVNNVANDTVVPAEDEPLDEGSTADRLLQPQVGRSFGLELLLRQTDRSGPYGWISYTLSRSERRKDGGWVPYDFDKTHLLNLVAGLPLPRNWDLSLRLQYQSGKPTTTTAGYNTGRVDGYVRVDLRIDKRAVYKSWLLDFYVDITNIALLPEEVAPGQELRYVLPTFGLRGRI